MSIEDHVYWRYLPRGRYAHALMEMTDDEAVCGKRMDEPLGAGSQGEYERVTALTRCPVCIGGLKKVAEHWAEENARHAADKAARLARQRGGLADIILRAEAEASVRLDGETQSVGAVTEELRKLREKYSRGDDRG